MSAVCRYGNKAVIFFDRSFVDVMDFVAVHVASDQFIREFQKTYEVCLKIFMQECQKKKNRKIHPVQIKPDGDTCFSRFTTRSHPKEDKKNGFTRFKV